MKILHELFDQDYRIKHKAVICKYSRDFLKQNFNKNSSETLKSNPPSKIAFLYLV